MGQLDVEGYHVDFGGCQGEKGNLVVVCGQKCRTLYMVEVSTDGESVSIGDMGTSTL